MLDSLARAQPQRFLNGALQLRIGAGRVWQRERHGDVGRDAHAFQPLTVNGKVSHRDIKQAAIGQGLLTLF